MIANFAAARPNAERTLTDRAVLTTIGEDRWDNTHDKLIRATHTVVWDGPCSLGQPGGRTGHRTGDARGADENSNSQELRLPHDAPAAVGQRAYINPGTADLATLVPLVVARLYTRSHNVLQRVQVVSLADAETVPR